MLRKIFAKFLKIFVQVKSHYEKLMVNYTIINVKKNICQIFGNIC